MSAKKDEAVVTFTTEVSKSDPNGRRPMLHVLLSDGRVTEFRGKAVVIPEAPADEAEAQVLWLAVNGKGEMFVNERGEPVIMEAPGMSLGRVAPNPDSFVTLSEIAEWSGLSESTVERAVERGELAEPTKLSRRRNGYLFADVQAWIAKRQAK
jgi:predicted DNA-binding transcriptional regulator AlpA